MPHMDPAKDKLAVFAKVTFYFPKNGRFRMKEFRFLINHHILTSKVIVGGTGQMGGRPFLFARANIGALSI